MGLFDEVNKAVVNQQQVDNYSSLFEKNGIAIKNLKVNNAGGKLTIAGTVTDMAVAEKTKTLLASQPGVQEVVNLLEIEDLTAQNIKMKVATQESNLNVRKGPGTEFEIVGKAAHNSTVQLIKRMYNNWYYIRTEQGVEGFCSKTYLQDV